MGTIFTILINALSIIPARLIASITAYRLLAATSQASQRSDPLRWADAASSLLHISQAMQGRTTLIIFHSVSLAQLADQILVLEAGEIVEQGLGAHRDFTIPCTSSSMEHSYNQGAL